MVSWTSEVVLITIVVSITMVPATTLSPGPFGTGADSPVIIDSSIKPIPSSIVPSNGTVSPASILTSEPLGTKSTIFS